MSKDWKGDSNAVYKIISASNHTEEERETNDYYATDPAAMEMLLELEQFSAQIWEPACGEGHLSKVLSSQCYQVMSTDLYNRGYGTPDIDFLNQDYITRWDGDIITNPPYKYAKEFVEKALSLIPDGRRVAMFMKLTFLEGKSRRDLFAVSPPSVVYVSSSRINCAKNGDFSAREGSAVCYCWFVWQKGFTGEPVIRWFN